MDQVWEVCPALLTVLAEVHASTERALATLAGKQKIVHWQYQIYPANRVQAIALGMDRALRMLRAFVMPDILGKIAALV